MAILGISATTLAGGFGPTLLLAEGPKIEVDDIAAKGANIVVGMSRSQIGHCCPVSFIRWSTDGGATFGPERFVGGGSTAAARVDICRGW